MLRIETEIDDHSDDLAMMTMEAGSGFLAYRLGIFPPEAMVVVDELPFLGQVRERDRRFLIAAIGALTAGKLAGFDEAPIVARAGMLLAMIDDVWEIIPDLESTRDLERPGMAMLMAEWETVLAIRDALVKKQVLFFGDIESIVG